MTKRIFHSILGACLFVLAAAVITTVLSVYQGFVSEEVARLGKETRIVANVLNHGGSIDPDLELFSLGGIRLCLIDADGTVEYDSFQSDNEANHADRQEIIEASQNGEGSSIRYSQTLSTETYNAAVRLDDGSYVRLSQSHSSLLALFARSLWPMLLLIPALAFVAYVIARLLARNIVVPINAIDLANPLSQVPYEQLRPLLEKLDSNNRQIAGQLRQLEENSLEFEALSTSMSEGLVMVNAQGRPAFINQAARKIFSITTDDWASASNSLNMLLEQGLNGQKAGKIYPKNGRIYSLEATPIRRDERIIGAMVLAMDSTEKQEAALRRQEFTANVTHELKTPLQTISSSAELLSSGMVKEEDVPTFAGYIFKEARRLSAMVNDILHLSRIESQSSEPDALTDLCAVAKEETEQMTKAAALADVHLEFEGEQAYVLADRKDLSDIVRNLVENAIRYNRPDGYVRVTVANRADNVELRVEDGGMGIAPEIQERIFERFYTADPSRSQGGTGLGLAIVKHAASNLGSEVLLDSEPGKGSTFTILFPRPKITDSSDAV